jgi:streptogramin lyase
MMKSFTTTLSVLVRLLKCIAMLGAAWSVGGFHEAHAQPLKIFILAGQSNMQGHAHVRTLEHLKISPDAKPLRDLIESADGAPKVCERVWISSLGSAESEKTGLLSVGYGANQNGPKLGPEYTFGLRMEQELEGPVLIIKTAWGGKSLHTDFRPPSAGAYSFPPEQLANFQKQGKDIPAIRAEKENGTGVYYRMMIEHVKHVLSDIPRVVPGYRPEQGYELAGFVWFQGWNDMVDTGAYPNRDKPGGYDAYSETLAHFIRDVRTDLHSPKLPFVIGVLGVGGPTELYGPDEQRYKATHNHFRDAMAAPAKLPEFQNNVVALRTEAFWDKELSDAKAKENRTRQRAKELAKERKLAAQEERKLADEMVLQELTERDREIVVKGISNLEFHYLGSAKILGGIGVGFADAMLGMLQSKKPLVSVSQKYPVTTENWTIETIAGTGEQGHSGDGGPALLAKLDNPFGVIRGPDHAIWFCEYTGQRIRRILPDGTIQTIAGSGKKGYTGDGGPATEATFNLPHEIRFDSKGDLYIVDMANHVVRKIEMRSGIISTIAGTGAPGYSGDGGLATQAQLKQPHSIQFGPDGDLFICDIGNHVIRRVHRESGEITTFAGTGKAGPTPDGAPIVGTPLKGPRSIDFDRHGDMWLATREGNQVFRFHRKTGTIQHMAGTGESGFDGNGGPAKQAKLKGPKGIAIDADGHVWLADTESHSVRRIRSDDGVLELVAGTGEKGDGPDGDPMQCRLARLHGIFVDYDGSVWIGDSETHRIRVLRRQVQPSVPSKNQVIELVAGGKRDEVDIPAKEAKLREPFGLDWGADGTAWVIEMAGGNRLLSIDPDGVLRHRAGKLEPGFSGDGGDGLKAQFQGPHNLSMAPSGRLYIADTWNGRIRTFDPRVGIVDSLVGYTVPLEQSKRNGPYCATIDFTGRYLFVADLMQVLRVDCRDGGVEVVAGNGRKGIPNDGALATESPLVDPRAAAPDRFGNVYVLERNGNALRVVDPFGRIRTLINPSGEKGVTLEATSGADARLSGPKHLCIDHENRVVIADAENHVVLRYDPRIDRLERIAGTGSRGDGGVGGAPLSCQLARPHGVSIHPKTGELWITDSYNDRILRITNE